MNLKTTVNKTLKIEFEGDIKKKDTDELEEKIKIETLLGSNVNKVGFDFNYVDSVHLTGLIHFIEGCNDEFKKRGKKIVILNPQEYLKELFELIIPYIPIEYDSDFRKRENIPEYLQQKKHEVQYCT